MEKTYPQGVYNLFSYILLVFLICHSLGGGVEGGRAIHKLAVAAV